VRAGRGAVAAGPGERGGAGSPQRGPGARSPRGPAAYRWPGERKDAMLRHRVRVSIARMVNGQV